MAKKVSKTELNQLRRKKGVKVKRRMGSQPATEKPGPQLADSGAKSGAKPSDAAVPASDDKPKKASSSKPYAAMAATIAASHAQTQAIIEENTKTMRSFRDSMTEMTKPRKRVPWDATVHRNKNGLIERVRLEPDET